MADCFCCFYLFLLLFLVNLGCAVSEISLRLVFITEIHEPELSMQIGKALKMAERSRPDVKVRESIIPLDRENDQEAIDRLCAAVANGVSMIIDLSWTPWEVANQLAADAALPLVRTALHSQRLVAALDEYLNARNATDAALILETEQDVDRTLYSVMGTSNVRIWAHAGFTRDAANVLKAMRPEPSFYNLIGDQAFVMESYRRAVKEKLVRRDYRWNLVFTDYATSNLDLSVFVIPTMILHVDSNECCRVTGQRDGCSCPADINKTQYHLISLLQYIMEVYSKLEPELPTLTTKLDCNEPGAEMNGTSGMLYRHFVEDANLNNESVFYWDGKSNSLHLRSRYILSSYTPEEGLEVVASWSAREDFHLPEGGELQPLRMFFRIGTAAYLTIHQEPLTIFFWEDRNDRFGLFRTSYTVRFSSAIPWTIPVLDSNGEQVFNEDGQPVYEGYCIDLMDKLAESMGFDYEIITPKSGGFGRKLPNGTWDGIVGDLMTGETDMAVSALTMTAEREEVIDFVAPYFEQTGILIAIRKPIRKTSLFKFMTVLRTEVWLSIVAALILTGFMIWLLDKYSPYSARNNPGAYPYPCREFTLKESFWFALTSFTPQGGGEAPKALSGRTLVAAYWLFVVLMLATFTANLAAFLTVERMQTPVASLEQLARQSRINYTVIEGSTIHQYFINMKFAEDTLYRVWKEITLNATSDQSQYRVWDYPIREQYGHILLAINASGPVPDAKTGFQQVNEHTDADFAFIHDSAEIKYEITRNCNLTEVGEVFAEQPYAIAVQQGSRLQEDMSRALLELQKERFLEQLANKYWNETARQACPDADESEGITLESLGGVFIATLFGLGLAMLTLAWEVFYYKRKERNKVQSLDATKEVGLVDEPPLNTKKKVKPSWTKAAKKSKIVDGVARLRKKGKTVTIGDRFKPVANMDGVAYISVYPKIGYRP